MYEVQVNIRQIMRISLCSGASVRGFSLLCTDAAVFIVFGLIWCSVGAHIGDSVYRRDMGSDGICGSGPVSGFRSVECSGKTGGEKERSEGARAKVDSRRNASGRKCTELFTNTFRKSVKMRVLGFKNFGRKYVKIFAGTIVNSKKMTIFATH